MSASDSSTVYMPILKWKRGEHKALINLEGSVKESICPCAEIRDLSQHDHLLGHLHEVWGGPLFVDYADPSGSHTSWRVEAFTALLDRVNRGFPVIPVINPSNLLVIQNLAIRARLIKLGELAFRARIGHKPGVDEFIRDLKSALVSLGRRQRPTDIIIDFRSTPSLASSADPLISYLAQVVRMVSTLGFRRIFFASGAYPIKIDRGLNQPLREDFLLWQRLKERLGSEFPLLYSDYTVVSPLWEENSNARGYAAVRYTVEKEWIILKANGSTKQDSIELSELLVEGFSNVFKGAQYSYGDLTIFNRAEVDRPLNEKKAGNETHLMEGVNHHITYIVKDDLRLF